MADKAEKQPSRIGAYWRILRPINGLSSGIFAILAVAIGSSVSNPVQLTLVGLATALLMGHTNILNDIIDEKIDLINQPNRVIPAGLITRKQAAVYAVLTFIVVLLLSAWIDLVYTHSYYTIAFAIVFGGLSDIYNGFLKQYGFLGNAVVALADGAIFFYGDGVDGKITMFAWSFGTITFFLMLAREIIKGIMDIEGDKSHGVKTLAVLYGPKAASKIGAASLGIMVAITYTLFVASFTNLTLQILTALFDLATIWNAYNIVKSPDATTAKKVKTLLMLQVLALGLVLVFVFLI